MNNSKIFPDKIYHATIVEHLESILKRILINRPDANINLDFGKGFYTTTNYDQAVERAELLQESLRDPRNGVIKRSNRGVVITFDLDSELLYHNLGTDNYKVFDGPHLNWTDWAEFVVNNRNQSAREMFNHNYDWSYGPMADGNVGYICREYKKRKDLKPSDLLNGYFDEKRGQYIKGLTPYRDQYDQLVFHNEELVNSGVLSNPRLKIMKQKNLYAK